MPYTVERRQLADGRTLTYRRHLERNTVGHFTIPGTAYDGWLDGWPLGGDG